MWTTVISVIALILALVANAFIIICGCVISHQSECNDNECKICGTSKDKEPEDK